MRGGFIAILVAVTMMGFSSTARAISVDIDVLPKPVRVGDIVEITVSVDTGTDKFDGFELKIDYDPAILTYRKDLVDFTVFTPVWFITAAGNEPTPPDGTVIPVTAGALFDDYMGVFDLVTLAFEVIQPGTTIVTLSDASITGFLQLDGAEVFGDVTLEAEISTVPLPLSVLLLPTALAGLVLVRRRATA